MAAQTITLTFSEEMELSYLNLISDKISTDISNLRIQSLRDSITVPETKTVSIDVEWNAAPVVQKAESAADPVAEPDMVFSSGSMLAAELPVSVAAAEQPSSIALAAENPASESAADPVAADTTGPVIESITGYDVSDPVSVTVSVTVSDAESGVAGTAYTVNGGPWTAF